MFLLCNKTFNKFGIPEEAFTQEDVIMQEEGWKPLTLLFLLYF